MNIYKEIIKFIYGIIQIAFKNTSIGQIERNFNKSQFSVKLLHLLKVK